MAEVSRVLQSRDEFKLDDTFTVWVQHAAVPTGGCFTAVESSENQLLCQKLHNKRCVISIRNSDDICLPRALVVGRALADGNRKLLYRLYHVKRPTHLMDDTEQTRQALQLIQQANLPVRRYSLEDLDAFHAVLGDYMIIVVGVEQLNSIIYATPFREKKIMILLHSQHFDVLTSLPAWFERNLFCFHCVRCYDRRESHRCTYTCKQCLRQNCADRDTAAPPIQCPQCNRPFRGQECFAAHKKISLVQNPELRGRSICQKVFVCKECDTFVSTLNRDPESAHRCGEVYCPVCRVYTMPGEHTCYMKPHLITPKELKEHQEARFLYLDFETFQCEKNGVFIPNVAVIIDDEDVVTVFPRDQTVIEGDITNEVCNFIFAPRYRGYYVLAHNFRGFDGYFILKWLTKNGIVPEVIMDGSKILRLDVKEFGVKFRDTLSYVPLSLAKWATAFQVDQAKGSFPHPINCPENWNRVITYPSRKAYGYETMAKNTRKEFIKIYRKDRRKKRNRFDVNAELIAYCKQDVRTLKACSESLRRQFQDLSGGLCIFSSALTIAGVCGFFWRSRILQEEQVELVHRPSKRASSRKAKQWLHMVSDEDNVLEMEDEAQTGSWFVDGYDNATMTVYEFYGCLHHGHDTHTRPDTVHPWLKQTMADLFRRTMERERRLIRMGYGVKSIWECQFDRLLKCNAALRQELASLEIISRLDPRDSLYGGRVNATVLHHCCTSEEKIHYYDVISEYPFVNKTKRYPIGKHTVITRNFATDLTEYFGVLKVKVLPPRDLWIPILPYRTTKLTFPLCRSCADCDQQAPCQHSDEERALVGVWCSVELNKAIERGYRVLQCFEVWHYPETRERLFAEYIDHFLALKTQASGWPAGVQSEEEKAAYLKDFYATEGVQLDRDKMVKNAGMRALAKLCLNSFWGKLAMRDNKPATVFIRDPHKFHHYLNSTNYNVTSFDLINEDVIQLTYTLREDFVETNPKTNVVLAAFTTAHARLHLLQFLEMCGRRTLYFDTDSIIYVCGPRDTPLPTGHTLGCLTSELSVGEHIVEFCSTGAKSYSYVTNKGHSVCKVKGFTLSRSAGKVINFHSMRDLLTRPGPQVLPVHYPFNIRRRKRDLEIDAVSMVKKFKPTYTGKRVVDTDTWITTPYGFDLELL